jgi:hypothetical protein
MGEEEDTLRAKREAQDKYNARRRERRASISPEERRARRRALMERCGDKIRQKEKRDRERHKEQRARQYAEWYLRNKEKVKQYAKERREKQKEQMKIKRREYDLKNKEKIATRSKKYRDNNKEKVLSLQKDWRDRNPDAVLFHSRNRVSRKRANGGFVSKEDLQEIMGEQSFLCVACFSDLRKATPHLDHIMPLSKGGTHTKDNIQFLCAPCNLSKHAKHPLDWIIEIYMKENS